MQTTMEAIHVSRRPKCSFCHHEGHNITTCNSNVLKGINDYLIYLKCEFMILNDGNRILAIKAFENYIYDYCSISENNVKLIKYVACRFYNTRLHSLLQISINQIILHLYDIDIAWLTFHEYNFVPFNQNTPVRITSILNGILLNYISNEEMNNFDNNFDTNVIFDNYAIKINMSTSNSIDNPVSEDIECAICYNNFEKKNCASFECKHEYCVDCVQQLVNKKHTNCPYCREKFNNITCYSEESYIKLDKLNNLV